MIAPCASPGDEYAQTRNGNNNWYGHDTKMTRFEWNALDAVKDTFFRLYRCISHAVMEIRTPCCQCHCD